MKEEIHIQILQHIYTLHYILIHNRTCLIYERLDEYCYVNRVFIALNTRKLESGLVNLKLSNKTPKFVWVHSSFPGIYSSQMFNKDNRCLYQNKLTIRSFKRSRFAKTIQEIHIFVIPTSIWIIFPR